MRTALQIPRPNALLTVALCAALGLLSLACIGRASRRDARTLRDRCGLGQGRAPIDEAQARCVARVFGVLDRADCPMEVDRSERRGQPVYRVREACTGLGVEIDQSTGHVVAVIQGERVLRE